MMLKDYALWASILLVPVAGLFSPLGCNVAITVLSFKIHNEILQQVRKD
jgi:hypothetical protein